MNVLASCPICGNPMGQDYSATSGLMNWGVHGRSAQLSEEHIFSNAPAHPSAMFTDFIAPGSTKMRLVVLRL